MSANDLATPTETRRSLLGTAVLAGTLVLLLALNFGVRRYLDRCDQTVGSFLTIAYKDQLPTIYAKPWYRHFLPAPELTGSWSTTGLILVHGLEQFVRKPYHVFYFTNALMVSAAFLLSWAALRSYWFSTTFGLCLALSTHNHHVYCVPGTVIMPLIVTYLLCFLYCQYKLLQPGSRLVLWSSLSTLSLLVYALSYEGWLDGFVYLWLAYPLLIALLLKQGDRRRALVAGASLGAVTLVAIAYVVVKTKLGHGQSDGTESDVVFNYHGADRLVAIEDVISHYFTIFYISFSNFFPPEFLVNSVSYWKLGPEHLIALQNGYHSTHTHLVPANHIFLWRYYAGFACAICGMLFYKTVRRAFAAPSVHNVACALFLLMVLVAGPTHILVKWRPMHAVPTLGYHAYFGVVGMALLISYGIHYAMQNFRRRWLAYGLTAVCWLLLGYGALARPAMLSNMNAVVGFTPYPDAMQNFRRGLSKIAPARSQPAESESTAREASR